MVNNSCRRKLAKGVIENSIKIYYCVIFNYVTANNIYLPRLLYTIILIMHSLLDFGFSLLKIKSNQSKFRNNLKIGFK